MPENVIVPDNRSVAAIIAELREEISSFASTRIEMLQSELHDSLAALKAAVPLGAIAAGLLATGSLLLTAALVSIIVVAFDGNPLRWFYSFLIVGILWMIGGGTFGYLAVNAMRTHSIYPKRTMEVLKADKVWLQSEARSTL